jgi:hypothetical protein
LQNKANFRKSQIGIKLNMTRDYDKKSNRTFGENKPNQSQSPPAQGWGLKVANDVNYPLMCLKNLPINLTCTFSLGVLVLQWEK